MRVESPRAAAYSGATMSTRAVRALLSVVVIGGALTAIEPVIMGCEASVAKIAWFDEPVDLVCGDRSRVVVEGGLCEGKRCERKNWREQ